MVFNTIADGKAVKTYNINVVSNDTTKGTVSGTTQFKYFDTVLIPLTQIVDITTIITPMIGCGFDNFTTSIGSISDTELIIPSNTIGDITVTANFISLPAVVNVNLKRDGNNQSGETVIATCDGQATQTKVTDSSGNCVFDGLAAGTWTFTTSNTAYVCSSVNQICLAGNVYSISLTQITAKRVGGTIFYIDNTSTGGTYHFYTQAGVEISSVAVGDTPYWYSVSGTPSKDKYYIAEQKDVVAACTSGASGVVRKYEDGKYCVWSTSNEDLSSYSSQIDVLSEANATVGTGRRNTNWIFTNRNTAVYFPNGSGDNYSCWDFCKACNTAKTNGCDDWFVPSIGEVVQLRQSGIWGSTLAEWTNTVKYGDSVMDSILRSSSATLGVEDAWTWATLFYLSMEGTVSVKRFSQVNTNFYNLIRAF